MPAAKNPRVDRSLYVHRDDLCVLFLASTEVMNHSINPAVCVLGSDTDWEATLCFCQTDQPTLWTSQIFQWCKMSRRTTFEKLMMIMMYFIGSAPIRQHVCFKQGKITEHFLFKWNIAIFGCWDCLMCAVTLVTLSICSSTIPPLDSVHNRRQSCAHIDTHS